MKTIEFAYKWTLNLGIVLAIAKSICSYGKIPVPIPYLADAIRAILIVSGIGFTIGLVSIYGKAARDTFNELAFKIFGLFFFYFILDIMAQKIVAGEFNT